MAASGPAPAPATGTSIAWAVPALPRPAWG